MTRSAAVPAGTRLVFGASGYIGSNLVPALVAAGHRVRATARNVEVLEARGWDGVDLVPADALDVDSLRHALEGVDTAYYLVHSMAAGRDFAAIDRQAAGNFARAAADAGVRRIVYLGGLIPPNPRSQHLLSRAETGEVLRSFPVPVTEIRAGMIIGPGSAAFEVIRDLVNHLPVMITPAWVSSRSTPIALPDLLAYLVAVADLDEAAGRVLDAGGPDAVTYEQIMRCYGRLVGRKPRILAVPVLTPKLSSHWLRFVTSVPTNVARALVEGLEHDFVADDAAISGARATPPDGARGVDAGRNRGGQPPRDRRALGRRRDRVPQLPPGVRLLRDAGRSRSGWLGHTRSRIPDRLHDRRRARLFLRQPAVEHPPRHRLAGRRARASVAGGATRRCCASATSWTRGG